MTREMTTAVLVAALAVSCAMATAQGIGVSTPDGVTLEMSANGEVTGLRIGEVKLRLVDAGGFAIADFHNQPEPVNLVPNPGFEEGAEGWNLGAGQSIDEEIVHAGKRAVRLEVPGPDPGNSNVGCLVQVKPNTRYHCELWVRREKVGVCGAYVSERDDQNTLTGKHTQVGAAIPQVDGQWHKLIWDLTTQPETTRLSLRSDIYRSTGTLWLDDFSIAEMSEGVYLPIEAQAEATGDGVTVRGGLPQAGLELEATLKGDEECIRVEGVVRDTTREDRAVGVRFALPLDAEGWTWYTDAEEQESVAGGGVYRYTYDCASGIGVCSIYPWSALSGPEAGLTLALPLSQGPRVFVIQHDQRVPETSLTFYFGLARDAGENPSRAPFSFVIHRHDPAWGMRSAMERYYRLFPESFVKRPRYEGYLNYAALERFDPKTHRLGAYGSTLEDASDFGEGYKFLYHVHGCYDFRMVRSDDPKRPSDETVMGWLQEMAEQEKEKPKHYVPSAETMKKLVYGPEGQIRYIGDTRYWRPQEGYNHNDWPGWGLNFRVNEDPGVSAHLANVSREMLAKYAEDETRQPFDACFTADAIEGYHGNTRALDHRREHFATTLVPLTFAKESLEVGMPNTIWDFHKKAWWPLTEEYQVVTYGNANGYEQMFTMPFVDIPMIEWCWDRLHPGRFDRYLRATAHHKIWRYWRVISKAGYQAEKDEASVRYHFGRCLAYAVYPCVGPLHEPAGEKYRDLFRRYVPAIEELSIAGWEPLPHARATEGVIVERYGSFEEGELHFTFRSYDEEDKATVVTLEREGLGIPARAELVAVNILPGQPQGESIDTAGWQVSVTADGSQAFWVGTREQMAQHGFRLAERTLGKIGRLFATELTDKTRTQIERAKELAQRGAQTSGEEALRVAGQLQEVASELEGGIETAAPVDLTKLAFRLNTDLGYVPVAALGLTPAMPSRSLGERPRGEATSVQWALEHGGTATLSDLKARVRSPWQEYESTALQAGAVVTTQLPVPEEPERPLIPYLLEITGKGNEIPFTIALPMDVTAAAALGVSALPQRVFRGEESQVNLTVTNRLKEAGTVTLKFSPPAKTEVEPSELTLKLGAERREERLVTMRLAENARLGELNIAYEISSENAKFNMQGRITLKVTDPVPRVSVKRAPAKPEIDGNLTEEVWQGAPTIPELRLLANGGPATEKTAVWVAYDNEGLYLAFKCAETQMDKLKATFTERGDPLYRDDDVEIFVLPPGAPSAFQLAINALGTISDNFGNKAGWVAGAQRLADAWTVEVFIPYEAVGVSEAPRQGSSWALQLGRQQKAKAETTSWTPGRAFNVPEGFGEIVFD